MRFVRGHVLEFSHHLGELDYTDLFIRSWDTAQFIFIPGSLESQLIMYVIADTSIAPCYVYVHEDTQPTERAIELGEFTWFSLRRALMEQLTSFRGRLDLDYSPSKPALKIARFTAVAASWFAQSP